MMWKYGKLRFSHEETTTSGGSKALTASSPQWQFFDGTMNHDLVLPDATTTSNGSGIMFSVVNASTGAIAVKNFGGSTLKTIPAGASVDFFLAAHGTANGTWRIGNFTGGGGGGLGSVAPGSTITSNYVILSGDRGRVINVDSSVGAISVTLPTPSAGFIVTIKDYAGHSNINQITVVRAGSELIDSNASSVIIRQSFEAATFISDGTDWYRVGKFLDAKSLPAIGLIGGGFITGANTSTIDQINIAVLSDAKEFANITVARGQCSANSSKLRGVWVGGYNLSVFLNTMDFVEFSNKSSSANFGNAVATKSQRAGCGSATRGLTFCGGDPAESGIEYITFATRSNGTSFGTATAGGESPGAASSTTRAICAGGGGGRSGGTIDYVEIATTANALAFGTLSVARRNLSGVSSSTRAVFGGNDTPGNQIDYVTIATTGNALDFGDLTVSRGGTASMSSSVRGVFGGGHTGASSNVLDYITIATLGNALDFGDLTQARNTCAGVSNAHGGL